MALHVIATDDRHSAALRRGQDGTRVAIVGLVRAIVAAGRGGSFAT